MGEIMRNSSEAAFLALRRDADEVVRLRARALDVLARRRALAFSGFGDLLDHVLPMDPDGERRVARALNLPHAHLSGLRASELDPASVPSEALTALARAVGLDRDAFTVLLTRDHARFAAERGLVGTRTLEEKSTLIDGVATAWRRAEMDDASDY